MQMHRTLSLEREIAIGQREMIPRLIQAIGIPMRPQTLQVITILSIDHRSLKGHISGQFTIILSIEIKIQST